MKYFLDTEFIERFHQPKLFGIPFGKPRHVIDLISIGIVCEDGREYGAISNEYRYADASEWVKQNIINPLYSSTVHGDARNDYDETNFHKWFGKSNKQIAQEVIEFTGYHRCPVFPDELMAEDLNIQFYGYYSDYDWVLLCSLFGTMMDLPKGFPMYCRDLKQTQDESESIPHSLAIDLSIVPASEVLECHSRTGLLLKQGVMDLALNGLKDHPGYPKQTDEHNALADARWNKKLFEFLRTLREP